MSNELIFRGLRPTANGCKNAHVNVAMSVSRIIRRRCGTTQLGQVNRWFEQPAGFSVVELMVVVLIAMILAGFAISSLTNSLHGARLRGAASDLSGLYEQARIYAIRD